MVLLGASNGLFLLQETYNLDIKQIARGIVEMPAATKAEVRSIQSLEPLSPNDLEVKKSKNFNDIQWKMIFESRPLSVIISRNFNFL